MREIKMNKKVLLSAITVCFLLTGCANLPRQVEQSTAPTVTSSSVSSESAASSTSTISKNSSPSEQLKSIFEKYTIDQITFFQSFTIGNNQTAAFVVAGGDVWYVTSSGVQKLKRFLLRTRNVSENFLENLNLYIEYYNQHRIIKILMRLTPVNFSILSQLSE
jgi:PBP1b-binding outer membrane lipoprotein LpoB